MIFNKINKNNHNSHNSHNVSHQTPTLLTLGAKKTKLRKKL